MRALLRERDARASERALRRAASGAEEVVVGPFVGEVGFELLYWIPFVRRALREHRIGPERVTVLSRGGAAAWYEGLAGRSVEILDLVEPERLRRELEARRDETGHTKAVRIGPLDRELLARAGEGAVLHPVAMYTRLRYVWDGLQPLSDLDELLEHAPLRAERAEGITESYVFFRPYFNACFPDTEENRRFLDELLARLSAGGDVVVVSPTVGVDEHAGWEGHGERVRRVELDPRTNLAVQTDLVARAAAFVTTHGGLSYLGPLLGVPTYTFRSNDRVNPVHFQAMRAAVPGAAYTEIKVGEPLPFEWPSPVRT